MSYAIQRRSGLEQNKLYRDDTGIHDWYRFVLSFPPHLVRCYLEKFQLNRDCIVLDPFCGTGTTLVESKKHGIASIGVEANPVVQMAARAKVDWNIDCAALLEHSLLVAEVAEKRIKKYGNSLKSLAADKQNLLIKHSISPIPLHKSLVFFEVLNDLGDSGFYDIECTAFAKQLVYSYSNLQFGPEVGVGLKRKNDVDVVQLWLEQIRKIVADLRQYTAANSIATEVYLGDARSISTILNGKSIDAVITSPPYPNEKDYTRTTRLESVLLDFMVAKSDLRNIKENLLRSNTRNIYKHDDDEKWVAKYQDIMELAHSIEAKRIELGKTSGFERLYHRVVKNYFGGLARHLEDLKPVLRRAAYLAYVVGEQASYFQIPIKTGKLLSNIAVNLGYEAIAIELFRTRLSTTTKAALKEQVVLLRWGG